MRSHSIAVGRRASRGRAGLTRCSKMAMLNRAVWLVLMAGGRGALASLAPLTHRLQRLHCTADNLIVVIDFDLTLTSGTSLECHDIVGKSLLMPAAVRTAFRPLLDFSKPFPPELEKGLWWERANEILVQNRREIHPDTVKEASLAASVALRPGAKELLSTLNALGVPTLICSAGITNIIQAVLEDAGVPHDSSTLTISSNRLVFDKELNIRAVEPSPPVTSYNKAQTVERNRDWFNSACDAGRKTLLVIGDRISDLEVARGAAGAGAAIDHKLNVASIGIFNDTPHGPQIVLEDFASHFDAVIIGDNSSLEPVRKLVEVDLALAPHLTSRPDAPRAT